MYFLKLNFIFILYYSIIIYYMKTKTVWALTHEGVVVVQRVILPRVQYHILLHPNSVSECPLCRGWVCPRFVSQSRARGTIHSRWNRKVNYLPQLGLETEILSAAGHPCLTQWSANLFIIINRDRIYKYLNFLFKPRAPSLNKIFYVSWNLKTNLLYVFSK